MVNAHSHAFQRGLRGRAERPGSPGDDFWTWREEMYRLADGLDPESIEAAGLETYREMAAAGYGALGEFHYVHHRPGGEPYDDPNAMAKAVARAARAAGLRVVLLPAAYHRAGPGAAAAPRQLRFCDPDVETFLARVDALRAWAEGDGGVSVGVAAHSARAVPASWLSAIASWSDSLGAVRHVHAAEQPREVEEVRAEHGCSPIELLERTGFLGPAASVVHAIHVSERDVELLAASGTTVVSCPTTEGNLGDGCPPLAAYLEAGVPIAIGSDSQVRIDPFEEARELETLARREGLTRHALLAAHGDLWEELRRAGLRSLGIDDAGTATIDTDHPDLSGVEPEDLRRALVTCASAAVVVPPG
jgi:formimidoylglutamate deiminase